MNKQIKILKIIDEWNWAFDFIAEEQSKHSKHLISKCRVLDLPNNKSIFEVPPNIVYFPTVELCSKEIMEYWLIQFKKVGCIIIGGYAGEIDIKYPLCDYVVSISAPFVRNLSVLYPDKKITYLPEGINDLIFVPTSKQVDEFTVGWAGRISEVKRTHLLDLLDYKVLKQGKEMPWTYGPRAFLTKDGRTLTLWEHVDDPKIPKTVKPQDEMVTFYQDLSVFVLTSSSECMPRVILEAMSCGKAVVSTKVGSLPEVVPEDWLVPIIPEDLVVKEINSRLHKLEDNKDLLLEVGKQNRDIIEKKFSWSVIQPLWDSYFESLMT